MYLLVTLLYIIAECTIMDYLKPKWISPFCLLCTWYKSLFCLVVHGRTKV